MISQDDVKKIVEANREAFATKDDFSALKGDVSVLKGDVSSLRNDFTDFQEETRRAFSELLSAVDSYAKRADTFFQEMVVLAHKVDRHEKWIQQIAQKLGVKLDY